jgi:hypothetical protein
MVLTTYISRGEKKDVTSKRIWFSMFMQLFPQFFIAFFPCSTFSLLSKSFIIYDIYSPKRDSKRLTWHYSLSLLYTKEREREREKESSNAGFYLRQIFNLNFFRRFKAKKEEISSLLFSKENTRCRTFMIITNGWFFFQRIIRNNLEPTKKYF